MLEGDNFGVSLMITEPISAICDRLLFKKKMRDPLSSIVLDYVAKTK